MAKLIPFPFRQVRRFAMHVLSAASHMGGTHPPLKWRNRPVPPERMGNMLQRLAVVDPYTLLVLESIVAEVLKQIDR